MTGKTRHQVTIAGATGGPALHAAPPPARGSGPEARRRKGPIQDRPAPAIAHLDACPPCRWPGSPELRAVSVPGQAVAAKGLDPFSRAHRAQPIEDQAALGKTPSLTVAPELGRRANARALAFAAQQAAAPAIAGRIPFAGRSLMHPPAGTPYGQWCPDCDKGVAP
jgi:hypothetical protein